MPACPWTPYRPQRPRRLLGLALLGGLLLNLGDDMPSAALEFERVLEVVGSGPESVRAGRARYRIYQQAGARLEHFSAAG